MPSPMIQLKNVSKWYGPVQVLNNCSVEVAQGDVVVVCGPSGSGKSTLIKTVNALEPVQKGEIIVNGITVTSPQTDLPKHVRSGLKDATDVLRGVDGVSFTFFESRDVVRHPLVARIVNAYEARDARDGETGSA